MDSVVFCLGHRLPFHIDPREATQIGALPRCGKYTVNDHQVSP